VNSSHIASTRSVDVKSCMPRTFHSNWRRASKSIIASVRVPSWLRNGCGLIACRGPGGVPSTCLAALGDRTLTSIPA
jgi:hypothetical protein